jgi:hypothetical protein
MSRRRKMFAKKLFTVIWYAVKNFQLNDTWNDSNSEG